MPEVAVTKAMLEAGQDILNAWVSDRLAYGIPSEVVEKCFLEMLRVGAARESHITPEMIAAGVDAVADIQWEFDSYAEMAVSIYSAMVRA